MNCKSLHTPGRSGASQAGGEAATAPPSFSPSSATCSGRSASHRHAVPQFPHLQKGSHYTPSLQRNSKKTSCLPNTHRAKQLVLPMTGFRVSCDPRVHTASFNFFFFFFTSLACHAVPSPTGTSRVTSPQPAKPCQRSKHQDSCKKQPAARAINLVGSWKQTPRLQPNPAHPALLRSRACSASTRRNTEVNMLLIYTRSGLDPALCKCHLAAKEAHGGGASPQSPPQPLPTASSTGSPLSSLQPLTGCCGLAMTARHTPQGWGAAQLRTLL